MAQPSLDGMPIEMLVHIASYLPVADVCTIRLTNKRIEQSLWNSFALEFFTKRQFMITTRSLQTLVDISKHGTFSKMLKHIIIGIESYESIMDYSRGHAIIQHITSAAQEEAIRRGFEDHFALRSSGRDRDLLVEAFRNLPHLHTIGIRDYYSPRARDGGSWRSYGAVTVREETQSEMFHSKSDYPTQMFILLLQSLAHACRPVPNIEVIFRRAESGLRDFAFSLPPADSNMQHVLDGINTLLLTLHPNSMTMMGNTPATLISFLQRVPRLTHLRLNFSRSRYPNPRDYQNGVLDLLSTTDNILPQLRRLDFGSMDVDPEVLMRLVSKFALTLRYISLWKVCLLPINGSRWLDAEDRYHPWPRLLQDFAAVAPLTGMTFGSNKFAYSWGVRCHVSADFTGDVGTWLPKLLSDLDAINHAKPPPVLVDGDMDEDEDDDDEDEDDDDGMDEA